MWENKENVVEMLKSGLFIRAYEPQVNPDCLVFQAQQPPNLTLDWQPCAQHEYPEILPALCDQIYVRQSQPSNMQIAELIWAIGLI